jgi:hypothetical protein
MARRVLSKLLGARTPALVLASGQICPIALDAISLKSQAASFLVLGDVPEPHPPSPQGGILFV